VTRPHLGVASAVSIAVLDFGVFAQPLSFGARHEGSWANTPFSHRKYGPKMTEKPWKMSSKRPKIACSYRYVDNNSTPTMFSNLLEVKCFPSLVYLLAECHAVRTPVMCDNRPSPLLLYATIAVIDDDTIS